MQKNKLTHLLMGGMVFFFLLIGLSFLYTNPADAQTIEPPPSCPQGYILVDAEVRQELDDPYPKLYCDDSGPAKCCVKK